MLLIHDVYPDHNPVLDLVILDSSGPKKPTKLVLTYIQTHPNTGVWIKALVAGSLTVEAVNGMFLAFLVGRVETSIYV